MQYKCLDEDCLRSAQCAHFTAPEEPQQQYFAVTPRWNGQECNFFFANGIRPITEEIEELHNAEIERLEASKIGN